MKTNINQIIRIVIKRVNQKYGTNLPLFASVNDLATFKDEDIELIESEFNELINYPRDAKFLELVKKLRKESGKVIRNYQDLELLIKDFVKESKVEKKEDNLFEVENEETQENLKEDNKKTSNKGKVKKNKTKGKFKVKDALSISKHSTKIVLTLGASLILTGMVFPGVTNLIRSLTPTFQIPTLIPLAVWTYALATSGYNAYKIYKTLNIKNEDSDKIFETEEDNEEEAEREITGTKSKDDEIRELKEKIMELEKLITKKENEEVEKKDEEKPLEVKENPTDEAVEVNPQTDLKTVENRLKKLRESIVKINNLIDEYDMKLVAIKAETGLSHTELYNKKVNPEYVEIFNKRKKLVRLLKACQEAMTIDVNTNADQFNSMYDNISKVSNIK